MVRGVKILSALGKQGGMDEHRVQHCRGEGTSKMSRWSSPSPHPHRIPRILALLKTLRVEDRYFLQRGSTERNYGGRDRYLRWRIETPEGEGRLIFS